jgi:hypothetical protein
MTNEYMNHGEIQETSQGVFVYPLAADGSVINTPVRYDGFEWTVKPDQSAKVSVPKGQKGATGSTLTKDMTTHTVKSDVPMYEAMLLPLLMTFRNRSDATTLITPTANGTNGYLWETYIREGERDYMQNVKALFGNSDRHQQVGNISGSGLKLSFSTNGTEQTFSVEMTGTGGKLRDPVDGGDALDALPAASSMSDVEIDASSICVYASDVSRADLDRRSMFPQTTAAHTVANADTAAAIATAVQTLLQGLANINGAHVTVTGAGGALGTADVTLDVEFVGDFANQEIWDTGDTEDNYGMIQIGGTYTGGTITVTKHQTASATLNEIQRITIPSAVTGGITFTVNVANTVLMPELGSFDWSVDNRNQTYKFARCSDKRLQREGSDNKLSYAHMANDYGMVSLARVRNNRSKNIWVTIRAVGSTIDGAVPSHYSLEVTSAMLITQMTDMPFKDGWKMVNIDGVLASDSDFISAGNGALARARLCCTQSALFVQ